MKCYSYVAVLLAIAAMVQAQEAVTEGHKEQKFLRGNLIRLHLSAGGYTISGTDSDVITVTYGEPQTVRVDIKTADSAADVSVGNTPHSNFHARIEVPRRSDLWVRLSAGELKVEDVEGNKDVESRAGDVDIELSDPDDYGYRDTSVTAGSLDATAFNVSKGGLFRSYHQDGTGKYRLHAHVGAGDLTIRSGK